MTKLLDAAAAAAAAAAVAPLFSSAPATTNVLPAVVLILRLKFLRRSEKPSPNPRSRVQDSPLGRALAAEFFPSSVHRNFLAAAAPAEVGWIGRLAAAAPEFACGAAVVHLAVVETNVLQPWRRMAKEGIGAVGRKTWSMDADEACWATAVSAADVDVWPFVSAALV